MELMKGKLIITNVDIYYIREKDIMCKLQKGAAGEHTYRPYHRLLLIS